MTTPPAETSPVQPWTPAKLAAVLTEAVYEHFTDHPATLTLSSREQSETFDLLINEDGDVFTLVRKSDGARFEADFWVNVAAAPAEVPQ